MNNIGATQGPGDRAPDNGRQLPPFIETLEPAPVHDLLVMSHGPDARPADRSNHACLNSFTSSSWIMSAGGRPNTMLGLK
jgi:hypothetical protein